MDDLQKLLEMAGLTEGGQLRDTEDALNRLSRMYRFELSPDGSIDVYAEYEDEGWKRTSRYQDFDQMLKMHGHQ